MENKNITIGRDKKCDLVIEDIPQNAKVSGRHATIYEKVAKNAEQRAFILEDHSTNGTFVNSKFVHNGTCNIKEGDVITLGRDFLLSWDKILPFFEGRRTQRKPANGTMTNRENETTPNNGFVSADPVFPDSLPHFVDGPIAQEKNKFVFTGAHWAIAIGSAILGFVLGLLLSL